MNKNIIIGILAAAVIVLLIFLLNGGKQHDSHKDGKDLIEADNKILRQSRDAGLKTIDSLKRDNRSKDTVNARLRAERDSYRSQSDKKDVTVARLAGEVKRLSKRDTTDFGMKCDSLAEEVVNLSYLFSQYKTYADSLDNVVAQQKANDAVAFETQTKLYDELQQKYDFLYKQYQVIFDDYSKARKTIKRERLKTKIAAVLGLVGAGLLIVK